MNCVLKKYSENILTSSLEDFFPDFFPFVTGFVVLCLACFVILFFCFWFFPVFSARITSFECSVSCSSSRSLWFPVHTLLFPAVQVVFQADEDCVGYKKE